MKITSGSLIALLCVIAFGCTSRVASNADLWRDRAAQVTVGMTRTEVETLLPLYPSSPITTVKSGGSQSTTYWVDENWNVSVAYDYTGIPRDAKGTALDITSPQNRVLMVPVLSQAKMPNVEVKTIETIEPTTEPYSK